MKSNKSMKKAAEGMTPGKRVGNKYCRWVDGKTVEHRGGRYAPGSYRSRKYKKKDEIIADLRAQVEALTAKIAKLEEVLAEMVARLLDDCECEIA